MGDTDDLFADAQTMWNAIDPIEDEVAQSFYPARTAYDDHFSDLLGDLSASTTIAYGQVDPEADYGAVGGVLLAVDSVLSTIWADGDPPTGAWAIVDDLATLDYLRLQGIDETLRVLNEMLESLRVAIGGSDGEGGLKSNLVALRQRLVAAENGQLFTQTDVNTVLAKYTRVLQAIAIRQDMIADWRESLADQLNDN